MNAAVDDLVVRLQATLDEVEARANAEGHNDPDEGGYYACPATRSEPLGDLPWGEDACTCGLAKRRADVLRLVQSHRDLIAEWRQQAQIRDLLDEPDQKQSDAYLTAVGIAAGLWAAVTIVARGYGIEA